MRLTIAAVGRMKPGAELDLLTDYLKRATGTGKALALGPFEVLEVDDRKAQSQAQQSARLLELAGDARIVALDERGKTVSSPDFAQQIAHHRDDGCQAMMFLIGGADGHMPEVRKHAALTLSFGAMVWPHMLARVMLAEQLYRATSILAGAPYHRT